MSMLEYMKSKLGCSYISDLKNRRFTQEIIQEIIKNEKEFSTDEMIYLLDYLYSRPESRTPIKEEITAKEMIENFYV